jgi:hypothetical protein
VKTPLELDDHAAAAALRAPGRRGHRRAARQGRHRREDAERRVGAVAERHLWRQRTTTTSRSSSHVEPFDLGNYAKPDYYWGYQSAKFNEAFDKARNAPRPADRLRYLGDAQRLLAEDAANVFLFQPQFITVASRNLRGLWKDTPIFVNDIAALYWA